MPNGEFRFRLTADDGSAYIRTVAAEQGAWQNSHYHVAVLETYIVQSGWIVLAELIDNQPRWHYLEADGIFTTKKLVAHNLYMPGGAVIHTVKHGQGHSPDWHASEALDALTQHLTEAEVYTLSKPHSSG